MTPFRDAIRSRDIIGPVLGQMIMTSTFLENVQLIGPDSGTGAYYKSRPQGEMKLMGTGVLVELMAGAGAETLGAVCAFHAELVAADWRSPADFLAAYPGCDCDDDQALVALGDRSVVLRFNFARRCVLLETLGRTVGVRRALEAQRQ